MTLIIQGKVPPEGPLAVCIKGRSKGASTRSPTIQKEKFIWTSIASFALLC